MTHITTPESKSASADAYRFYFELLEQLKSSTDAGKVLKHFLARSRAFYGADSGVVAVGSGRGGAPQVILSTNEAAPSTGKAGGASGPSAHATPAAAQPTSAELSPLFASDRMPKLPPNTIAARIARRGRANWGAIVLRRADAPFPKGANRSLTLVAQGISDLLEQIEIRRIRAVRARIDGKILAQLSAKDLYYQILDGLHSLTRYDHSAALLLWDDASSSLELVAEQVAWIKGKSARIGLVLPAQRSHAEHMRCNEVYGFSRHASGWEEWSGLGAAGLIEVLDCGPAPVGDEPAPREESILCATLGTGTRPLGLLKLSGREPDTFGPFERDVVTSFAAQASLGIQRSEAVESIQARMIDAERRSHLGDVARGVAHDINNALGELLLRVPRMRQEAEAGQVDPKTLSEDLRGIEDATNVCLRIFRSMLRHAKDSQAQVGPCDIKRAANSVLDLLGESLRAREIEWELAMPEDLPLVVCRHQDLDRLFHNLASNARDAMPRGGRLSIRGHSGPEGLKLHVQDTGVGIPADLISKVEEPFFGTKSTGTGLGLSICRSIVQDLKATMKIESIVGQGTTVVVGIPPAALARPE